MQKIELTSKLVLAIIGLVSVGAILVPTYAVPTIKSGDIFDGEVKTADLANGAVTNSKLANDAVTSGKIKNGEVKAEDIAAGVIPPSGGIQLNIHKVESDGVTLSPNGDGFAVAVCPSGEVVIGGGFQAINGAQIRESEPGPATSEHAEFWRADATGGPTGGGLTANAICIDPTIP
jgi:hypothetical protein